MSPHPNPSPEGEGLLLPARPHEAEAEAAHQMFADQQADHDQRDGGADGQRGLQTIGTVAAQAVEVDGQGRDIGLRQDQGEEKLAPIEDEQEEERHRDTGLEQRQDDFPDSLPARRA